MKKILLLCAMVILGLSRNYAQSNEKPTYYLVNYYKADRGKTDEYINLIKNYASKIWKEKVKSGDIMNYSLYSVVTSSDDGGYNLISLQSAHSINDFSKTSTSEFMKKAFPGVDSATLSSIANMYGALRVPVKSEIYKFMDAVYNANQNSPSFVEVNFMKTLSGKENEYVRQEKEIYKPIHQEFINNGKRSGWFLSQLVVPLAEGSKYNYVTSNFFNDWDKSYSITVDEYGKIYNKLFPKTTFPESARTMVKTEVWKLEVSAN